MFFKWWIHKKNSKKAAAILRRLLTAGGKGLPEMELEEQEKTYGHQYTVEETIKWYEEKEVKA